MPGCSNNVATRCHVGEQSKRVSGNSPGHGRSLPEDRLDSLQLGLSLFPSLAHILASLPRTLPLRPLLPLPSPGACLPLPTDKIQGIAIEIRGQAETSPLLDGCPPRCLLQPARPRPPTPRHATPSVGHATPSEGTRHSAATQRPGDTEGGRNATAGATRAWGISGLDSRGGRCAL